MRASAAPEILASEADFAPHGPKMLFTGEAWAALWRQIDQDAISRVDSS
jgi:hypothetical protein